MFNFKYFEYNDLQKRNTAQQKQGRMLNITYLGKTNTGPQTSTQNISNIIVTTICFSHVVLPKEVNTD